jgi:hypothetical protein
MYAEQLFRMDELKSILQKLDDISRTLDYLNCPIKAVGTLHLNQNGRYEMENGHEFSSGCSIEYLSEDNLHWMYDDKSGKRVSVPYWCASRIEHNGERYYIVGCNDELEEMQVRYR